MPKYELLSNPKSRMIILMVLLVLVIGIFILKELDIIKWTYIPEKVRVTGEIFQLSDKTNFWNKTEFLNKAKEYLSSHDDTKYARVRVKRMVWIECLEEQIGKGVLTMQDIEPIFAYCTADEIAEMKKAFDNLKNN